MEKGKIVRSHPFPLTKYKEKEEVLFKEIAIQPREREWSNCNDKFQILTPSLVRFTQA